MTKKHTRRAGVQDADLELGTRQDAGTKPVSVPDGAVKEAVRFNLSVLMQRRMANSGRWSMPQWCACAVTAGQQLDSQGRHCTLIGDVNGTREYLWSGLIVELYKDACESYWNNLLSPEPSIFVICHEDPLAAEEADQVTPAIVTPSQDEANAHMESDDLVFSVPMPEQVHQWVEHFVVSQYVPELKQKRKRERWSGDSDDKTRDSSKVRPGERVPGNRGPGQPSE